MVELIKFLRRIDSIDYKIDYLRLNKLDKFVYGLYHKHCGIILGHDIGQYYYD